jgi:hypothetical protein
LTHEAARSRPVEINPRALFAIRTLESVDVRFDPQDHVDLVQSFEQRRAALRGHVERERAAVGSMDLAALQIDGDERLGGALQ